MFWGLGFRVLGVQGLGLRDLGFRVLVFRKFLFWVPFRGRNSCRGLEKDKFWVRG